MFPDVTGLLIQHLTTIHAPVLVSSRVPDNRPAELVQVRRVGGVAKPPVRDAPVVDFKHWAATETRAVELALATRNAIWALSGSDLDSVTVYRIEETLGLQETTDPVTESPMALITITLDVRADAAIQFTS